MPRIGDNATTIHKFQTLETQKKHLFLAHITVHTACSPGSLPSCDQQASAASFCQFFVYTQTRREESGQS